MKKLSLCILFFAKMASASTICYKSNIGAISEVFFNVKNSNHETINKDHINGMSPGRTACVTFNENENESVDVSIFHLTGIIWHPRINTCNFENLNSSKNIVSMGNSMNYKCIENDL